MTSEVLLYINSHLDSKITLETLADVTGYSPFHIHKKLSAELGTSLGRYIQEQRLHTAAYFLALTQLPVHEIKYLIGFEDDSSFGRAFKKLYEVSPLQYRKSKQHQQAFPGRVVGRPQGTGCEQERQSGGEQASGAHRSSVNG